MSGKPTPEGERVVVVAKEHAAATSRSHPVMNVAIKLRRTDTHDPTSTALAGAGGPGLVSNTSQALSKEREARARNTETLPGTFY